MKYIGAHVSASGGVENISFHMTVTLSIWGIRRKRDFKKVVPLFWMKCNVVSNLD